MTPGSADPAAVWADAALATELFAVDPFGVGGLSVRAWPGPQRDQLLAWVRALMPRAAPLLRLPLHITDDRLLGGLSLAATLRAGKVVVEQGLLAQANGGALIAAMAERLEPNVASHLCAALDRGELALERDGITATVACRLGVVALDEGLDDERTPASLRDRLGLQLDLNAVGPRSTPALQPEPQRVLAIGAGATPALQPDPQRVLAARALLPRVALEAEVAEALCQAAVALGIDSLRAPVLAAHVARVHAALHGRTRVEEEDATVAARLVLGPRATRLPPPAPEDSPEEDEPQEDEKDEEQQEAQPPEEPPESEDDEDQAPPPDLPPLDELLLEAAKAAMPKGVLDALALGLQPRSSPKRSGKSGALRASTTGGRPAGVRPGIPERGERLNVVETLRAAAPWQPLRRKERGVPEGKGPRRLEIRKEDFRVSRFKQRTETCVIFSVDASGSAALQRLAEAKGAVEQVLVDCYVRRDQVALIAFRGLEASLLLPPTRSLVRVRRSLADLAGGGTTPLAAGIDAALTLALEARAKGQTPVVVLMTDGKGNVPRMGREGKAAAEADALAGAQALRAAQVRTLFLDTAPRPRPAARALADAMGARYLPLPYVDAAGISRQVQSLAEPKG